VLVIYLLAPGYPARAQKAQLCSAAKFVSACGRGGTSEIIRWLALPNGSQSGSPNEDGNPRWAASLRAYAQ
jgi:hypothetical protein